MRTRHLRAWLAAATLTATATLAACTAPADDADEIAAALEQDQGGLDFDDEAPEFGLSEDLAAADLEGSVSYDDAYATEVTTASMRELPGAVVGNVVLMWGQLPPDRAPEDYARDWSGRLRVDRGAIIVRRTIGFEEATDRVAPRTDRTFVDVRSITRPLADGLVLTIVDPDPSAGPMTLHYDLADGTTHALDLAELLAGPVSRVVDDQGDRIVAVAVRDRDACDHGFGRGRWRAVRDGLGGLVGEIVDDAGAPIGHIRGIWGERRSGEQVFFGKYIDLDGQFRGIFGGHYRDGELRGRWLHRSGEIGRLGGHYRESLPGRPAGGHFVLRWAETSCAAEMPAAF